MTHKRLISAAAGSLFAVSILAGCSEAEDLANEAKDSAASAASDAASNAKDAASGAASDAKSAGESAMADATGGANSDGNGAGRGGLTLDLGKFANDPDAKLVGSFYEARQTAVESGGDDTAALKKVTSAALFEQASRVAAKANADLPFTARAVAVNGSTVDMCVGPDERLRPRTLTVADGKVTKNVTGKHSC